MLGRRRDYSTELKFDFRVTPRFAKTVGLRSIVELRNTEYTFDFYQRFLNISLVSKNTHVDILKSRIIAVMGYLYNPRNDPQPLIGDHFGVGVISVAAHILVEDWS